MDKIAVLDFGGQYAHLIANRIRRLGVYSEVKSNTVPAVALTKYKGVILSGGPQSVYAPGAPSCDKKVFQLGAPVLAICYGHQLMTQMLGGAVESSHQSKEYGLAELELNNPVGIFKDLISKPGQKLTVWMSHGDSVQRIPKGFVEAGFTGAAPYAAIAHPERRLYGTQFHVEVAHTQPGEKILSNFLDLCRCKRTWKIEDYMTYKIENIRRTVGKKRVFMLMSGGVDSTVAFLLLKEALGEENIYGLFVDTGLLRKNEAAEVEQTLKNSLGFKHLHVYDGSREFLEGLKGVYDAEQKRKIIGNIFLDIKDKVARDLGLDEGEWLLGQGTIYPDTIESGGTKHADKIKTHHNRIDRIDDLIRKGKVIEPLRQLYKDEVREVGEKLSLDGGLVNRHPFPGPGLAVRILCLKGADYPDNCLEVERQINNILSETGLNGRILPLKSVGVQGDARTYRHPLALFGDTDWDELRRLSPELTNQFPEINRVVYLLGMTEIDMIEVMPGEINAQRVGKLQDVDKIVMDKMHEKDLQSEIWQFPTVMIPLNVNGKGKESVVLRPVCSKEAMTANFAEIDWKIVYEMKKQIEKDEYISAVFYDVTNKPPGTIEWE